MRSLFYLVLVLAAFSASAQQASWIKNSQSGLYDHTEGKRFVKHPNGSLYVIGQFYGPNTFDGQEINTPPITLFDDAFLARYALDGTLIWIKRLLDPHAEYTTNRVIDIQIDSHGDLIIVGFSFNASSFLGAPPHFGAYIAKIDAEANLKWINYEADVNMRDADASRRGKRIVVDESDNIYWFCDQNFENGWENYEGGLALIKYQPDGTKVWNKLLTQNSTYHHPLMSSITRDKLGNFVVSGVFFEHLKIGPYEFRDYSINTVNRVQLFIASFNADGICQWAKQSNYGYSPSTARAHTIDEEGNIYFAAHLGDFAQLGVGGSGFVNPGVSSAYVFRISPSGNFQWAYPIRSFNSYDMAYGDDQNIYITGVYFSEAQYQSYRKSTPISESMVLKINRGGSFLGAFASDMLDDTSTPWGSNSYGYQSVADANGDLYVMGSFREGLIFDCLQATTADYSFYLVKFTKPVAPPIAITGPNDSYCDAANIALSATVIPGADYTWHIPDGATLISPPTDNQINLNITSVANQQAVMVSITDGCVQHFSEPFTFDITSKPVSPQLVNPVSGVCPATSKPYTIHEVDDADEIEWSTTSEISATPNGQTSMILNFSENFSQGSITITAKNQCGASSSSYSISVHPTPGRPVLNGHEIICGDVVQVFNYVPPVSGAISYEWQLPPFMAPLPGYPHDTNFLYAQVFSQFESGEIRVRAVGQCDIGEMSDPFMVSRKAKPGGATQLIGPDQICVVDGDVQYTISPIANATQYIWSVSGPFDQMGEIISESNILTLKTLGKGSASVSVYAKNACGEQGSAAHIDIKSFEPLPMPKLEKTTCDNEITVTLADSVHWFKNGSLLPGISQKKLSVYEPGSYTVRVKNFCGELESEPIEVLPVVESKLTFPNIITPNGDGKNDFFELDPSLEGSSIQITNRWGMEVYNANDYLNQWDGNDVSSGTYFYTLTNHCLTKTFRGWIQVLKE
jgi:gliding motility-associated-like protein